MMIQDFLGNIQKIKEINLLGHTQLNILVDTIFDISSLQDISLPFSITVFVFSEEDYCQFSTIFETFPSVHNIRYIPLYNKENLSFFESNIFIEKDEIDTIDLSKNDIFMRQALNTGNFGKLTIIPDGYVYANVNAPLLGTIDDSPYSIIVYKEFAIGQSWLKLRDRATCDNCVYQWLCPSPSDDEIIIGRPNLCHIKQ